MMSEPAVVIIAFNRPDLLQVLVESLRSIGPRKVYAVCDGARNTEEAKKVQEVRKILESLPWPHELIKIYSEKNLGCKHRVSSGLTEVFKTEDQAIVLEDDCIPHPTFFRYCKDLLDKYENDDRIGMISGSNLIDKINVKAVKSDPSYKFTGFGFVWGWATWKRVWREYDVEMKAWEELSRTEFLDKQFDYLSGRVAKQRAVEHWSLNFDMTKSGLIDTWDHQFTFLNMRQNRLNIVPRVNLVSNVGFRSDGTHTKKKSRVAELATSAMEFPLSHPDTVSRDREFDVKVQTTLYSPSLTYKIARKLREKFHVFASNN